MQKTSNPSLCLCFFFSVFVILVFLGVDNKALLLLLLAVSQALEKFLQKSKYELTFHKPFLLQKDEIIKTTLLKCD